jgi:diaminopimelate decarboxylase
VNTAGSNRVNNGRVGGFGKVTISVMALPSWDARGGADSHPRSWHRFADGDSRGRRRSWQRFAADDPRAADRLLRLDPEPPVPSPAAANWTEAPPLLPSCAVTSPPRDPALAAALAGWNAADADELQLGGVAARTLAERFGTPLYVFDAARLRANVARVQQALGERFGLLYSIKANPSLAVTTTLRSSGTGAEIASLGELQVALAAGHAASALRFAGPGKNDAEIAEALAAGVGCFHAESADEVDAIAASARAQGRTAGVAVRVNLPLELRGARMRMGGRSARFGVDAEQVPALLQRIAGARELVLRGLHVYAGTQLFDADAFARHARALCEHAARWEQDLSLRLHELDLGGGFGVPTYLGDPTFDLAAAASAVRAVVAEFDRPDRTWFVELGRYLVADAGVFLTRVVRRKHSGGLAQVALDGGLHQCAAAAGVGTVVRRPPLLVRATALRAAGTEPVSLGGPLCTPADQFAEELPLGQLQPGELLAVLHAGAYGLSYSPHGFLSHPTPAEVMVDGGSARLVRARGSAADALRGQTP